MRNRPTWTTIRSLFARSANQCAFPNCMHRLVNEDDLFIGEVCHIRAAAPGGPRYSRRQTGEERRARGNLVLLCHEHHVVVDSHPRRYTPTVLQEMKRVHERRSQGRPFTPSDAVLAEVTVDLERYWARLRTINDAHLRSGAPAIRLDTRRDPHRLFRRAREVVNRLAETSERLATDALALPDEVRNAMLACGTPTRKWDSIPYYESPVGIWNWEYLNIALPNYVQFLRLYLLQIEILMLENGHPLAKGRLLERLRRELDILARTALHVD